jgi:hypothetical protein
VTRLPKQQFARQIGDGSPGMSMCARHFMFHDPHQRMLGQYHEPFANSHPKRMPVMPMMHPVSSGRSPERKRRQAAAAPTAMHIESTSKPNVVARRWWNLSTSNVESADACSQNIRAAVSHIRPEGTRLRVGETWLLRVMA